MGVKEGERERERERGRERERERETERQGEIETENRSGRSNSLLNIYTISKDIDQEPHRELLLVLIIRSV